MKNGIGTPYSYRVKNQRLLSQNKALKKWVEKLKSKDVPNTIVDPPPPAADIQEFVAKQPDDDDFDGKIPEECFMSEYNEQTLSDIMNEQMAIVKTLKQYGKTKHLANRILIVFDDLVGSSLFSGKKDNPFKRLNTNHRHYSCSMLMVTQA